MKGYDWEAIRASYPLPEIAAQAVPDLKRKGNEWVGCCPFHGEKTPSFTIFDNDRRYHCFGCGVSGDVVDFVADLENVSPEDAIKRLTGGDAPKLTDEDRKRHEEWRAQKDAERAKERRGAIQRAQERWDRAIPISDTANAYLERKQVPPHGARLEDGKLLLPIYGSDGEIMSVQSIADDGAKLFQKNAPTKGGRFYIGVPFGPTIVCEGFATGASIFEASPYHVCITFSKGNMHNVARELVEQGREIILAADSNAAEEMRALGAELSCPVAIPACGSDFNDQAIEKGVDSVRETFAAAMVDFHNRPEPAPEPPACSIRFVEAFDFDESAIPLRPWLVPGAVMAAATHILAAPGGTGKSLFTLQFAIMLATGRGWGNWKPKRPCNVLIINAEDDIDEQRRRLAAARQVMDCDNAKGRLLLADNPSSILTSKADDKTRMPVATPLVAELVDVIKHYAIDAVIVDPFAETFEGDENSNNDAKWAMKVWRDDIARSTGAAVYLVHHTTKNSGDKAGSADAIRGAGALVNSARMAATMFNMDEEEANAMGVKPEDRFRYVKYDEVKSNRSLIGGRQWFTKEEVTIGNPADGYEGDKVGALVPWEPQGIGGLDPAELLPILYAIRDGYVDEDGVCTDEPFTPTARGGGKRWVGTLIMHHLGVDEDRARAVLQAMKDGGLVYIDTYHDEMKRKDAKGVFALPEKLESLVKKA